MLDDKSIKGNELCLHETRVTVETTPSGMSGFRLVLIGHKMVEDHANEEIGEVLFGGQVAVELACTLMEMVEECDPLTKILTTVALAARVQSQQDGPPVEVHESGDEMDMGGLLTILGIVPAPGTPGAPVERDTKPEGDGFTGLYL